MIVGTRLPELGAMVVSATVSSMVLATLGAGVASSSVIVTSMVPSTLGAGVTAVSALVASMVPAALGAGVAASSVMDVSASPVPQKRSTWKEPRLFRPWYSNSLSSPSAQIMWMGVPGAVGMICFDGSAGVVLRVKVKIVSPLSPPLWVELVSERSFSSACAMPAVD